MSKNKQELLKEASDLANSHQEKKDVIFTILEGLDKEDKVSDKHISGMATINEIMKELHAIEQEHAEILEKIKNK